MQGLSCVSNSSTYHRVSGFFMKSWRIRVLCRILLEKNDYKEIIPKPTKARFLWPSLEGLPHTHMIHSFTFHFSLMPFHVWILISSIMPGFPFFAYSRNWRLWIFQRKEELSQWINHSKHFFWCDVWGHLTLFSPFYAITTWIIIIHLQEK